MGWWCFWDGAGGICRGVILEGWPGKGGTYGVAVGVVFVGWW